MYAPGEASILSRTPSPMTKHDYKSTVPTKNHGLHCPRCDYDVRGLPDDVCPECGAPFTPADLAAYAKVRWRHTRLFRWLLAVPFCWFVLFVVFRRPFGTAADRVDKVWVMLLFLNIPLQLCLWGGAAHLLESRQRASKRRGAVLLLILFGLIVVHILISLLT